MLVRSGWLRKLGGTTQFWRMWMRALRSQARNSAGTGCPIGDPIDALCAGAGAGASSPTSSRSSESTSA